MKLLKLLFLSGVIVAMQAHADDPSYLCQNQITLQLQEEGWVTSKTALVTVGIQAATSKDDSVQLIQQITNKLKSVITDSSPWKLVGLSTEKNSAGLMAISATMNARLNNDQLTQLQGAIDKLNKAGEQFTIQNIDYQPQLSEISAEKTRLRDLIYHDVLEQQKVINTAFSSTNYQLQTLMFNEPYVAGNAPVMFASVGGATRMASAQNTTTPYSQQLMLTASVTFSSISQACAKIEK